MELETLPSVARRVLVVDDDRRNRDLLETLLRHDGFEVLLAADGVTALEIIAAGRIDLVLLDILMPYLDGIETCRRIRGDLGKLTLPIVFITSLDDARSRIRGREVGGDDYLVKPFNSLELRALIQTTLLKVKAQETEKATAEDELDRVRSQLFQAERLVTLGNLAAGVGHELGNIATVLASVTSEINSARAVGEHCEEGVYTDLGVARDHVSHHARALMTLGRPSPDSVARIDLNEVIASTVDVLRRSGRAKYVTVDRQNDDAPAWVMANRTRVEQVLINLIGNAVDAVGDSAMKPTIGVKVSARSAGRVRCRVVDNGGGISPRNLQRIFEPWFTTKPSDQGTGLGLSVVRQIVESYGGKLTVESDVGRGSTFAFDLPGAD